MDYMIFPRILALAERAWHKAPFEETGVSSQSDWLTFAKALGEKEFRRLEANGVQYRIPPPGARYHSSCHDMLYSRRLQIFTCFFYLGLTEAGEHLLCEQKSPVENEGDVVGHN
ncbi:hypothetical protein DPMN_030148 [Dreissena polymorpha]|uniref:Beta-N-acetylhexosaminidase n=1 Tax=Dreissena polymorpha TaxID=45954 RepID=A0A9D4LYI0_DREPO|nr:hypothetical protein DPMN_030148 [Dreissena polymorpha]